MDYIVAHLFRTLMQGLLGYILIVYVPGWLKIRGVFATIIKVIGVLIIVWALLSWF